MEMAEQFLTLMADLDDHAQEIMSGWYRELQDAGFTGVQTPGLPFHISLATFSLEKKKTAAEETRRLGEAFPPVPVHISHMGMFAGGRILFGAPDPGKILLSLYGADHPAALMRILADAGNRRCSTAVKCGGKGN